MVKAFDSNELHRFKLLNAGACAPFARAKKVSATFDVASAKFQRDRRAIADNFSRENATT